jgi:putative transposase
MRTDMVLDALEMTRWYRGTRLHEHRLDGLQCHSDAGSQLASLRYGERLADTVSLSGRSW